MLYKLPEGIPDSFATEIKLSVLHSPHKRKQHFLILASVHSQPQTDWIHSDSHIQELIKHMIQNIVWLLFVLWNTVVPDILLKQSIHSRCFAIDSADQSFRSSHVNLLPSGWRKKLTILKNDGLRQFWKHDPIMENKIHVWNHQPEI